MADNENWLVFIDTNIMLDFYRLPGEAADRQIAAILKHLDSIIVTEQVKMEFLKNRQKVIFESIKKLSFPNIESVPMIVSGSKSVGAFNRKIKDSKKLHKKVQDRVALILSDPARYDPVFRGLKKLFAHESEINLKRPDPLRFTVRNLARKRFTLGYPPRKSGDTSIGDALNWEWMIHCAQSSSDNPNIMIVSRDGDYGVTYEKNAILNDWLKEEFKKRVSQKRKIVLTNKLADALKILDENVPVEDERAEDNLIADWIMGSISMDYSDLRPFGRLLYNEGKGGQDDTT